MLDTHLNAIAEKKLLCWRKLALVLKCRRVCGWVGKRERVWCFAIFDMRARRPLVTTPAGGGGVGGRGATVMLERPIVRNSPRARFP